MLRGSTDAVFIDGIIAQLASAVRDGFQADLRELNFAFSVINGIAPRNELETMLAAQMFAVHNAIMKYARHVEPAGGWVDENLAARTLTKLAHTFVTQTEALVRLRTAGDKGGATSLRKPKRSSRERLMLLPSVRTSFICRWLMSTRKTRRVASVAD
jgi:hypothetical protein